MAFDGGIFSWASIFGLTMVCIAIWLFIEIKRVQHKIIAVALIILIIVGYIGVASVGKNNDVKLTTIPGIFDAVKLYFAWFGTLFTNVKTILSNAFSLNWGGDKIKHKT